MTAIQGQTIQTDMLLVPRPGARAKPMAAYLARPTDPTPVPGVVVIHELFGLNANIRDITQRFAAEGYVALAVDLFRGSNRALCLLRVFYGIVLRPLSNGTVADLQAAIDVLKAQSAVDPDRIGVIGFCMGGSYALQLACANGDLKVASVFYGQNPRPLEAVARACAIVGSYPGEDRTTKGARALGAALERFSVPHEITIYPGAQHSFFNDRSSTYNPVAAANAWARTLVFFQQYLRDTGGHRQGNMAQGR